MLEVNTKLCLLAWQISQSSLTLQRKCHITLIMVSLFAYRIQTSHSAKIATTLHITSLKPRHTGSSIKSFTIEIARRVHLYSLISHKHDNHVSLQIKLIQF